MSVLETPRLIFRGEISWDPITTNNHPPQYNEDTARTVFTTSVPGVTAYRQAAIGLVVQPVNNVDTIVDWNPDGTHRSRFYDTYVTGVDLGAGVMVDDPIVKCPISFTGMLVDLEPYGATSSQLFFDTMSFGIMGGCQVLARRSTNMTARYINFRRSPIGPIAGVAGVVWQTSFDKKDLSIEDHGSATLGQFKQLLAKDPTIKGLTVRWTAYRTNYFDMPGLSATDVAPGRALQAKLAGGGFQPNPARSRFVGVLGLWRDREPPSEPGDRAIVGSASQAMGSAHARLVGNRLVLDLSNTIPETTLDCVKADYGDLRIAAATPRPIDSSQADAPPDATDLSSDNLPIETSTTATGDLVVNIASIGYDLYKREAYERTAGIVTIDLTPEKAAIVKTYRLLLTAPKVSLGLGEQPMRAIAKVPNIYLDEGELGQIEVMAYDRGAIVGAGVPVTLTSATSASGASVTHVTNADGIAYFPLRGVKGQIEEFTLMAGKGVAPKQIDTQSTPYVNVRTLPSDFAMTRLPATWPNVHHHVLRNWEAMAPCMDNWLRLGDPVQVKSFRVILEKLTAKVNFQSFLFMPVTRDITAGQRSLLYRFLGDGALDVADAPQAAPTLGDMSRKMRGA